MVLVMLVALTSITMVAQESAQVKFDGYVVDQHCGSGMGAKANGMEKAAGHSKECALMEDCANSGYGVPRPSATKSLSGIIAENPVLSYICRQPSRTTSHCQNGLTFTPSFL